MQPPLLAISERLYGALLQAYPAEFRERFTGEMAQVFRSLCDEAYSQSGAGGVLRLWLPAAWDWAWSAMHQWFLRLSRRRRGAMPAKPLERRDGIQALSPFQAGLAALPFLLFGISSMVSKLEFFHTYPASLPLWQILLIYPYLVFNWLALIGLGAGLLAGFPRWAYSFLGWALLFASWWSDMHFYGYSLEWRIWLPLLGVFLVALLIRRSLAPLRALLTGMWRDWTLLSLGVYILYGGLFMVADGNHHPYLLLLIAVSALAASAGAWGYFRSSSPLRRVLALVGGLFLTILIGMISEETWDYRAYYGLPESASNVSLAGLLMLAFILLLMLGIGLLAMWRQARGSRLKGS